TAILLGHDIGSGFGSAEYGMKRLVDAAAFINTVVVFRLCILEARRQLDERDAVGRIPVDLVGAHQNERGVRAVLPGGFEQDHGAQRVYFEFRHGAFAGLVVRRLGSAVDDVIELMLLVLSAYLV